MKERVLGIHHLTAISGAPHQNYDFYTRVLGLKLVKKTVNFDDPGTYHLYYGDATGSPGSLLTFFPYDGAPGKPGPGQVTTTSYSVAKGELQSWERRLRDFEVSFEKSERFGQPVLIFSDPHGMGLEISESESASSVELGPFAGAVVSLASTQETQGLLEFLGYRVESSGDGYVRMKVPGGDDFLDLRQVPRGPSAGGPGTVHHIALRLPDDAAQSRWRKALLARGFQVSPITDRNYFHSIYFRGPEGVLYELATDPPGMLIDEDEATLGKTLRLPPQYEKFRQELEDHLAPLESAFRTFERPGKAPMLVGLHGTGGDEKDLIPLLTQLDPEAHLLTLRGQVSENGYARFFRRLREGVFDQRDLAERSSDLARFLKSRPEQKIVVGYSNGANIAAHSVMFHPQAFQQAILVRPMLGWNPPTDVNLSGHRILILIGANDTVVPPDEGRRLAKALLELGAHVDVQEQPAGHGLTPEDVRLAYRWLRTVPAATR
jgi:predicted esterase/catechol 2,3-dioxygenase-like lactoylglutathione lyase family enzyme